MDPHHPKKTPAHHQLPSKPVVHHPLAPTVHHAHEPPPKPTVHHSPVVPHQPPPKPAVHHAPVVHHQPPPKPAVHHAPVHHQPSPTPSHPAVTVHHVSNQTINYNPVYTSNKPTVRFYTKANTNYSLTIHDAKVILAPANKSDHHQHWIKEERLSTIVKDTEGFPAFALVNKATGQALKHATGATNFVQLTLYNPDKLDGSVLWTQSKDLGDGFHAVRTVDNIMLNLEASKDEVGIHDSTKFSLLDWTKGDNRSWMTTPFYKFFNANC